MTRLAIETAIRAWLGLAGVLGGVPNADRSVIFAHEDGPRPALPYLLVNLIVPSATVGEDESWADDAAIPQHHIRGQRYATVSVNAFGPEAYDWLDRAILRLHAPSVKALNTENGIAVQTVGSTQDLSGLRDTHSERRWVQDFRVDFVRETAESESEGLVELALVEVENTVGDRVETLSIEVT